MSKKKLQDDMKDFAMGLAQDSFNKGYIQAMADMITSLQNQMKAAEAVVNQEEK